MALLSVGPLKRHVNSRFRPPLIYIFFLLIAFLDVGFVITLFHFLYTTSFLALTLFVIQQLYLKSK